MEYNNYYTNQIGPPSNHQNGAGGIQLQLQPSRPHMMHVPVASPNIRHAPQAGLPNNHPHHQHHHHQQQQQQTNQQNHHIHSQNIVHDSQLIVPQMNHQSYQQVQTQSHFAHNPGSPHMQNHQQQHHQQQQHSQHQQIHHQPHQQQHHHQPQQHQSMQQYQHQQPHQQQQQQHQQQSQLNQQVHMSIQSHNPNIQPTQSPHSNMVSPMHIQTLSQGQKMNQVSRISNNTTNGVLVSHSNQVIHQSTHQNQPMQNFYNPSANSITTAPQVMQLHQQSQNQEHLSSQHQHHRQQQQQSHQHHHHVQQQQQQPVFQNNESASSSNHQLTPQPQQHLTVNNQDYERCTPNHQSMFKTEGRILELNRWLQMRPMHTNGLLPNHPDDDDNWWNQFMDEFFTVDATLTIRELNESNCPITIGRTLIPRFFKTYFEGGATDLFILLRNPRETQIVENVLALECDNACIIANTRWKMADLNPGAIIHSQGSLSLEFVRDNQNDLLIKTWKFETKSCREFLDRDVLARAGKDVKNLEPFSKSGLSRPTSLFLSLIRVMEPMQELMMQHQINNLPPKECLRKYLSDTGKFTPEENRIPAIKERRKRKATSLQPTSNSKKSKANNIYDSTNGSNKNNNNLSQTSSPQTISQFTVSAQEVLIAGEPTMMGCHFSDENTRSIITLENPKYDENAIIHDEREKPVSEISTMINPDDNKQLSSPPVGNNEDKLSKIHTENCDADGKSSISGNIDYAKDQSQQIGVSSLNQESREDCQSSQLSVNTSSSGDADLSRDFNEGAHTDLQSKAKSIHDTQDQQDIALSEQSTIKTESMKPPAIATPTAEIADNQQPPGSLSSSPENCKLNGAQTTLTQDQTCQVGQNEEVDSKKSIIVTTNATTETTTNHLTNNNACESVSEDLDDNRPDSADSLVAQRNAISLTNNTTNTSNNTTSKSIGTTSNGLGNNINTKQNRRRSSDRKETLREGLMRTSDFVVAIEDLKYENPSLWRISGNNLLQQFDPKTHDGVVLYENTERYAGWTAEIKKNYVGVDVKLTQHNRKQITVQRLLLNFQQLEDTEAFYDKHFVIYLQIVVSTALDPKFWEGIENEPEHHDYFFTSRRIIDDITKRFKHKLSLKLKLNETALKNVEKYPNLIIKTLELDKDKDKICRGCNTKDSTQLLTFGNRSYDLHSYKPVKLTNDFGVIDEDLNLNLCDPCLEIVKLYSEIHHTGWRLYNLAKDKVEIHRIKGKPINTILDECIKDEEWLSSIYADRDALWSTVDHMQ